MISLDLIYQVVPGLDPESHFWAHVDNGLSYLDNLQGMGPEEKNHFRYHPAFWNWYQSMHRMADRRIIADASRLKVVVPYVLYLEALEECFQQLTLNKELVKIILNKPYKKPELSWNYLI